MRALIAACALSAAAGFTYTVTVTEKRAVPALSLKNPVGSGYSPCTFTFNPAWLDAHPPGLNKSLLIVRASGCPAAYGGAEDHLLAAYCAADGTCDDLIPAPFPFEADAQDPRVFWNPADQMYYLYYFANGVGQATVFLRRTATPLNGASWEHVAGPLPWHRNGCVILRPDGLHYVIWGETSAVGIGISTTRDFATYTTLNSTWLEPYGPTAHPDAPEIVLEAAATPNTLSTGDYLHIYGACCRGGVASRGVARHCAALRGQLRRADKTLPRRSLSPLFAPPIPPRDSCRDARVGCAGKLHRRVHHFGQERPNEDHSARHISPLRAHHGLRDRRRRAQSEALAREPQPHTVCDLARARARPSRHVPRLVGRRRRQRRNRNRHGHPHVRGGASPTATLSIPDRRPHIERRFSKLRNVEARESRS
jgi:hypothetical protein